MTLPNARVLVLNRGYAPVAVTGVERAFGLLCAGVAKALDRDGCAYDFDAWAALPPRPDDDVVRSARLTVRVPRVLVLALFNKLPRAHVRFSRQNVFVRDGFTCQYCERVFAKASLNLDHVVPRSQGGATSWENIVCSCVRCNGRKGARTPAQAGMRLRSTPRRPRHGWTSGLRVAHDEWLPFLDAGNRVRRATELISA